MTESRAEADELPYWLALLHMPWVGSVTARALLQHWNTPRLWFESCGEGLQALERLNPAPAGEQTASELAHTWRKLVSPSSAASPSASMPPPTVEH
jgi:hypothetical protein